LREKCFSDKIRQSGVGMPKSSILLVDDDLIGCEELSQALLAKDFAVLRAKDAKTALGILDSNKIDLIILDMVLPGMDGYKFYKKLRRNKQVSSIPVIMFSGKDPLDKMLEKTKQKGFSYIIKGRTGMKAMLAAVQEALIGHLKCKP
jgi:PleD family two-component response regulator